MSLGIKITLKDADFSDRNLGTVPSADAFISNAGLTNETEITAIRTLFDDLNFYGLWELFTIFSPIMSNTAQSQKLNLLNPQDTDAAYRWNFINDNPAGHTTLGFKSDSASLRYGTVPFVFSNIGDFHISVYNSSSESTGTSIITQMATMNNSRAYVSRNFTGGVTQGAAGNSTTGVRISTDPSYGVTRKGLLTVSRIGSTVKLYDNGVEIASGTDSTGIAASSLLYLGAASPENATVSLRGYTNCYINCFSTGKGLTAQQVADLSTAINKFNTSLGRL